MKLITYDRNPCVHYILVYLPIARQKMIKAQWKKIEKIKNYYFYQIFLRISKIKFKNNNFKKYLGKSHAAQKVWHKTGKREKIKKNKFQKN